MFNLNVDSYNLEELKNLFNINPSGLINSVSMHEILEERYQKLLSSLNNNNQMNSIEKKKSNEFLFQAKNKLENLLTPQISNTTYQDSKKVDSLPFTKNLILEEPLRFTLPSKSTESNGVLRSTSVASSSPSFKSFSAL